MERQQQARACREVQPAAGSGRKQQEAAKPLQDLPASGLRRGRVLPPPVVAEVPESGLGWTWIDVKARVILLTTGSLGEFPRRPGTLGHARPYQALRARWCLRQPAEYLLLIFRPSPPAPLRTEPRDPADRHRDRDQAGCRGFQSVFPDSSATLDPRLSASLRFETEVLLQKRVNVFTVGRAPYDWHDIRALEKDCDACCAHSRRVQSKSSLGRPCGTPIRDAWHVHGRTSGKFSSVLARTGNTNMPRPS